MKIENTVFSTYYSINLFTGAVTNYSYTYSEEKDRLTPEYIFTDGTQIFVTTNYSYLGYNKLAKLEYGDIKSELSGNFDLQVKELEE